MRCWIVVVACVGVAVSAVGAPAQQRPISLGLAGGISLPQGELADGVSTGWHALATVALSTLMQPLGLRLDVAYNRFELEAADGNESVGSATLNATYRLPMTNSPMSPYLISGLGAYRSECSLDVGCDATTKFGWNVGLGTKVFAWGFRSFVEARYHSTEHRDDDLGYFPLTIGIMF